MSKIIEVIGLDNKHAYGKVNVLLDDGTEAEIYIGGEVEVFYHKERVKAYVKRRKQQTTTEGDGGNNQETQEANSD